jgi:hypothetical protein
VNPGAWEAREAASMGNWWMGSFKCEGWLQYGVMGAGEWYCPDISVIIAFERGGNTADQEAEEWISGMGPPIASCSGPRERFDAAHPAR